MQDQTFPLIVMGALYALVIGLILYQIELRIKLIPSFLCKTNRHSYKAKENGKWVNKLRCRHCGNLRSHPHLKILDGGKKVFETNYKF